MGNKTLIPSVLKTGDTIGIAAPASPFDRNRFIKGISMLESMGFNTYTPEEIYNVKGYLAGTDYQRAAIINNLFSDTNIKAVFFARGGFGSMKLLPLLDYSVISNNPKILIGYSDISALLAAIYKKCGLVSFHGPMLTTLGYASKKAIRSMLSVLTSQSDIKIKMNRAVVLTPGKVSGILLGGNLSTLCHLTGTPYLPNFKGRILFIEDRHEALYRIDRMLTHMKLAGCFKGLAGLVIGSFTECGPVKKVYELIQDLFKEYDIPVLAGLEAGHGKENLTIPFGLKTELDTDSKTLSFKW
ncbi:MAG: LD-carboxypeptidase [Desulfobacterium sp.]|nr:LD-carboxypeptidase [Desulfobacterium sp.]MBU3949133.1 LD-carboxypeptidase [Pseudomonadota bacterium]MBU4010938.1 LD-carboxypeptidase [Pseudomonadota bacterium]MBU4037746.1 LD-carboxypeptidase [Pseudomonadota bacterium]